jgi:hypothetical protein
MKKNLNKILIAMSVMLFYSVFPFFNTIAQESNPENLIVQVSNDVYHINDVIINVSERSITIPTTVNMYSGLIEVVMCRPEGKTHESLLKTNVTPLEFQTALLLIGLDPVNELPDDLALADSLSPFLSVETPGDSVYIYLESEINGELIHKPVEFFIQDQRTMKSLSQQTWLFRGALTHRSGHVIIDKDVTMIATYHDPIALMEMNNADKYDDELFYVNTNAGLTKDQPVKLIIQVIK